MQWNHGRLYDGSQLIGRVLRVQGRGGKVRWRAFLLEYTHYADKVFPRRIKQRTFDDQNEAKGYLVATYRFDL